MRTLKEEETGEDLLIKGEREGGNGPCGSWSCSLPIQRRRPRINNGASAMGRNVVELMVSAATARASWSNCGPVRAADGQKAIH